MKTLADRRALRVVTLGSDHPFTAPATTLVQELDYLEHVGQVKTQDEREFLRTPNSESAREFLASMKPDLFLSSGYGRVLDEQTLAIPTIGAINVHPSLLPQYRGYEAVSWALYGGESHVGITVHEMILPVDSGPILAQRSIPVDKDEDPGSVYRRLSGLIPEVLAPVLQEISRTRAISGVPQPPGGSFHPKPWREPDQLELDWTLPAEEIVRRFRLFRSYCNVHVGHWRIFFSRVATVEVRPGTMGRRRPRTIDVAAGDGKMVRLHLARPISAWAKLVLAGHVRRGRVGADEEPPGILEDLIRAARETAARNIERARSVRTR